MKNRLTFGEEYAIMLLDKKKAPRAVAAASGSFPRKIIVMHNYDTRNLVICQRGLVLFEEGGRAHEILR